MGGLRYHVGQTSDDFISRFRVIFSHTMQTLCRDRANGVLLVCIIGELNNCPDGRFLEFGLNYRGEIIDEITLGGVDEFLFEYVPRKVSTEPEQAASIVVELTRFWEYLDRVYELPEAKSIIEWLKMDGMVARLEADLSDPANFGMAKSIFMSGKAAGYDMTSEKGTAEFMAAYNRSLQPDVESAPAPTVTGRQRIGRNDPCPCGSGKKFKKCCR